MKNIVNFFYPEYNVAPFTHIDGTVNFYIRVNSLINKDDILLDLGCGRGEYQDNQIDFIRNLRIFKDKVKKVIGMDVDSNAASNPFLNEFHLIQSNTNLPLENESVSIVIADYVLEHIENPDQFLKEIYRVLKPEGWVCMRTPNRLNYISIISSLIPNRWHAKILSYAQANRKADDVFDTYYRCNTKNKIKKIFNTIGFNTNVIHTETEPTYFNFSKILYVLGVLHQKFIPSIFKGVLFIYAKK